MERKLNLDIPGSVAEFENLIRRVLPKNIFYKIIRSKGFEFDGYRDFDQDEDASNIDWKATVRSGGKLLARKYIEERDLKIVFLIDVSDNMIFGSTEKLKCEYAAELIAALSHVILLVGDRVGFVLFSNKIVKIRPPGLGDRQFSILSQELINPFNYGGESDLDGVLKTLIGRLDKSTSMIFIVSDFLKLNEAHKQNLALLSTLFETIALVVKDPLDKTFPEINKEMVFEDPKTNEKLIVNPKIAKFSYELNALKQTNVMKEIFRDVGIDFVEFSTENPFALDLANFLSERSKKREYKKQDVH